MLYAVAPFQPIHITQPSIPLLDFNSLKEGPRTMFSNELINRIYENDKTSGLTLMFMNSCLSNLAPDQKISPEYVEECYTKLSPLAKKISDQIETGEKSRRDRIQLEPVKEIACSPSFGMRRARP
jgi:hypothetical protein